MGSVDSLSRRSGAMVAGIPQPRVYTNYRRRPDGAPSAFTDSGHLLYTIKTDVGIANPTVSGGLLECSNLGTVAGAVYINAADMPNKLTRLGGVVRFDNTPGTATGEVLAFVAWNDADMNPLNQVDSHLHWAVGHANWSFGYVIDGVVTTLRNENQTLPYNTDIRCDAFVVGNTATLFVNGIRYTITDANIGSIVAKSAGWEYVRNATNQPIPRLVETWADDSTSVPGSLDPGYVDLVANPAPRAVSHSAAGTLILDTTTNGDIDVTATANCELYPGTTGAQFGRKILVSVLASGATRTVSVHSAVGIVGGATTSFAVPSGKVAVFGFRYSPLTATWQLLASGVLA